MSAGAKCKSEKCVIEVPSIAVVIESGIGYYTTPLIMFDTQVTAIVSNWSSNMSANGSLTLNMNYFNQSLATWEPIIEQIERLNKNNDKELLPWELNFSMEMETKTNEYNQREESTTSINIHSNENLEVTISKTFLDLLSDLSDAFSQALDVSGLIKPEAHAPFVVENNTGFDVTLDFTRGLFTLHECHMPNSTNSGRLNAALVFQTSSLNEEKLSTDQVKNCKVSSGGKVYLQTKDISTLTEEDCEQFIIAKVIFSSL